MLKQWDFPPPLKECSGDISSSEETKVPGISKSCSANLSLFVLMKFVLMKSYLLRILQITLEGLKRYMLSSYFLWDITDLTSW